MIKGCRSHSYEQRMGNICWWKSGRDVQVGELLYVAETNEEALEIMMAFIQYYRETANYLERIVAMEGTDWD